MINIQVPKLIAESNNEKNYIKIVFGPLPQGFGITIGHSLRRVLLSGLPGIAIQSIKFADNMNISHQFSSIKSVKEDIIDVILNLKKIYIRPNIEDYTTIKKQLYIKKQGPCIVTSDDIIGDAEISIVDKQQYICEVCDDSFFELYLNIGYGIGYEEAQQHQVSTINEIPIDSMYTPIQKVRYDVKPVLVGQSYDNDQLILEVWSNGAYNCDYIVSLASQILYTYLKPFSDLNNITIINSNDANVDTCKISKCGIEKLNLSKRAFIGLKKLDINIVDDFKNITKEDIINMKGIGKKTVEEIFNKIEEENITLKQEEE